MKEKANPYRSPESTEKRGLSPGRRLATLGLFILAIAAMTVCIVWVLFVFVLIENPLTVRQETLFYIFALGTIAVGLGIGAVLVRR